jgi:hypothetical protein
MAVNATIARPASGNDALKAGLAQSPL